MFAITRRLGILCVTAFTALTASAYEVCTPQNDYLESALPTYRKHPRAFDFPLSCIETAQSLLAPTGYYGYCATDAGQPGRTHPRPCLSQKYVGSVYNAMADVSECLNFDARWAFAVFNLESALHTNAVGAATDIGIGQLTSTAINEVNLNALPKALRTARNSGLDSCKRLLPLLYTGETAINRRCSFISLPKNPTHDLSFGVMLLKRNRELLDGYFKRWGMALPAGVGTKRVKTLLSMLGYNAGIGGVAATLRAYLNQAGSGLDDSHFDFENRSPDSFVTFISDNFPNKDAAVRLRVSKYVGFIIKSVRRIETTMVKPGHCSDPLLMPAAPKPHQPFADAPVASQSNAQAAADIEASMADLAQSFVNVHVNSAGECEKVKAEYKNAFAPGETDWESLPDSVRGSFKHLCAK